MLELMFACAAVIAAAIEVEAVCTLESVLAFTALVMPEVSLSVLVLISETIDDDAVWRLERVAREPESRVASLSLRVA